MLPWSSTKAVASGSARSGGNDQIHDQLIGTVADQVTHPALVEVGLDAALAVDPVSFICCLLDQCREGLVGQVWRAFKAEMQVGVEVIYSPAVSRCYGDLWALLGRLAE